MMRFGPNSGARKVWYCKRKTQKCHLRFCGTVNKKGYSFRKGVPLSGQTRTCLWYFCGQTRNRRGFYHGDFHFGGPNRDRTDDLTDANRTLSRMIRISLRQYRTTATIRITGRPFCKNQLGRPCFCSQERTDSSCQAGSVSQNQIR